MVYTSVRSTATRPVSVKLGSSTKPEPRSSVPTRLTSWLRSLQRPALTSRVESLTLAKEGT